MSEYRGGLYLTITGLIAPTCDVCILPVSLINFYQPVSYTMALVKVLCGLDPLPIPYQRSMVSWRHSID